MFKNQTLKNIHIVNAIFNDAWLISLGGNFDQIRLLVDSVLDPRLQADDVDSSIATPEIAGRVAVMPIIGVLTKYDGACGTPGYQTYSKTINALIADTAIDAIVLKVDSPGGQASGLEGLMSIIKQSPKPIVGYVDDLGCSAAYGILSSCSAIVANNEMASIGSIGVMATYTDHTEADRLRGIKTYRIYAPQSSDKNKSARLIEQGDISAIEDDLRVIAENFINSIKMARPLVAENQMTGDVYFAKDVIGTLVDQVGSIDMAAELALSLIPTNKQHNLSTPTTRIAATLGVATIEMQDGYASFSQEQLTAIETTLEAQVAAEATHSVAIATHQSALDAITAERDDLLAQVATLKSKPAASPSAVSTATDSGTAATGITQASAEAEAKKYL